MQFLNRSFALLTVLALVALPILAADDTVKQVNPKNICFMNKTRFQRSLPSVKVDGKTYYGCCSDCLDTLKSSPEARVAIDPVSGNKIDKADALIGVDKNGKVYFFENRENMRKFRVPAAAEAPTGL